MKHRTQAYVMYRNGQSVVGYRADYDQTCAGCGQAIPAGDLYTQHRKFTGFFADWQDQKVYPYCTVCFPVTEDTRRASVAQW